MCSESSYNAGLRPGGPTMELYSDTSMISPSTCWSTGEWETQNTADLQELNDFSFVGLKGSVIYLMNNLYT